MSSGAQVVSEIGIGADRFERRRSSAITVLANQRIDGGVFSKFLYPGAR